MEKMNTKTKHCVLAVSGRLGTENSSRHLLLPFRDKQKSEYIILYFNRISKKNALTSD